MPKCESRNDQPAMSQENKMMISAHAAPIQGLTNDVPTTLARMVVRKALSAASTVVNGLSRIRMLMALDARKTMKNIAIATGTIKAL